MIRLARTTIATIAATAALAPAGIVAGEPQRGNAAGLLEAQISEQPPIDFRTRGTRKVVLSFVVGAAPECTAAAAAGPRYAFLIDADRNLQTGTRTASFPELGIDSQVAVQCGANGRFTSTLGSAAVRQIAGATGRWAIDVSTTVGALPSVEFLWVAIARDGNRVHRLPASGRVGTWGILELVIR